MTPRILNLSARPLPAESEPCEPDVRYFKVRHTEGGQAGGNYVAFDANTLIAVEISKDQQQALTTDAETRRHGDAEKNDSARRLLFSGVKPKFDLSPDTTCRQLTLHLSDQCNQRCRYCWIPRGPQPVPASPPVMSREIAAAALEMFPRDGRDIRIGFFGGEPLLHFGLLILITEMAEAKAALNKRGAQALPKSRAVLHVTTNATLVTPIVAQFLADHQFSIIVSCDGPERLHDAARGRGSHAAMMRGLEMLFRAGCSGRTVLRGTWSGAPAHILGRLVRLNEMVESGLAAGVALEPVAGAMYGHTTDAEIQSACHWFEASAKSGATPRWQYLERTLQRILWQQFRSSECGAGRGYYTVAPDGTIYACHKQQNSRIGSIRSTGATPSAVAALDEAERSKWLDNRFCARRECSLCWARHVCGGACRSESLEFCATISEPHAGRCLLMRSLIAEALRLAAALPRETLQRICRAPEFRSC